MAVAALVFVAGWSRIASQFRAFTENYRAVVRSARTTRAIGTIADGFPAPKSRLGALVIAMLLVASASTVAAADWTLMRDRDGIQVYSRPAEGSAIREIRAVTRMSATPATVATVLRDVNRRPQWDHTCARAAIHATVGPDEQILYYDLDLPWPVEDRDMVMRNQWQHDPDGKITAVATSVADVIPPRNDRVRVTRASERWELQPSDSGGVTVVLTAHIDPAGPLPSWLVNSMSVDAPFDALDNLTKIVATEGR